MGNYVEEWGTMSSGRMLSWQPGDFDKYPFGHIWNIKGIDESKFKMGHDKLVKEFSSDFEGRVVGFDERGSGAFKKFHSSRRNSAQCLFTSVPHCLPASGASNPQASSWRNGECFDPHLHQPSFRFPLCLRTLGCCDAE